MDQDFLTEIQKNPKNIELYVIYAQWLENEGRRQESENYFKEALKIKESETLNYNFAQMLRRGKKFQQAIPHLLSAIRLNPQDADNYYVLGETYKALEKYQDAANAFKEAARKSADHFSANFHAGQLLNKLKRFPEAKSFLEEAVRIKPAYSKARYLLSKVYDALQKSQKAIIQAREAQRLEKNNIQYKQHLGLLLSNSQNSQNLVESEKIFRQVLSSDPHNLYTLVNYGRLLINLGRASEAQGYLRRIR